MEADLFSPETPTKRRTDSASLAGDQSDIEIEDGETRSPGTYDTLSKVKIIERRAPKALRDELAAKERRIKALRGRKKNDLKFSDTRQLLAQSQELMRAQLDTTLQLELKNMQLSALKCEEEFKQQVESAERARLEALGERDAAVHQVEEIAQRLAQFQEESRRELGSIKANMAADAEAKLSEVQKMLQDAKNMQDVIRNEQQRELERMKAERSQEITTNNARWATKVAQSSSSHWTKPAVPPEESSSSEDKPAAVEPKPKQRLKAKKGPGKKSSVMERLRKKNGINNGGAPILEATEISSSEASGCADDQSDRGTSEADIPSTRDRDSARCLAEVLEAAIRNAMGGLEGRRESTANAKKRCGRKPKLSRTLQEIKETESPDVRTRLLEICQDVFKKKFGVSTNNDFIAHASADKDLVQQHAEGLAKPDKSNLHFDMTEGPDSLWNAAVIDILVKKVMKECGKSREYLPERPEEYFLDMVRMRYSQAWDSWRQAQPQLNGDEQETAVEVETWLLLAKEKEKSTSRMKERRVQKYHCRLQIAERTIECKEQEQAPDVKDWKWLKSVIETLGHDGMSSEESMDEGDLEVTYWPKILEWRRNIDHELKILDSEYVRFRKANSHRGRKPAPRRREGNKVSTQAPVCRLPLNLYNEAWLLTKTDEYVDRTLNISEKLFKWRVLRASGK